MNWHKTLISGILAAALTLTFVPRVAADPLPWAGVWRNDKYCRDRGDFPGSHYGYRGYEQCRPLLDRIDHDRGLIAQWQYTIRHQKVVSWAREDIAKARGELYQCRSQGRFNTRNYGYYPLYQQPPRSYDPYYPAQREYGPYYDRGFDWKRDWPLLLGTVINGQMGR